MRPEDYMSPERRAALAVLKGEKRATPDSPQWSMSANPEELWALLGVLDGQGKLPPVSIETALEVPAVLGTVNFMSATLASLPLHAYRGEGDKLDNDLAMLLNEAPNEEWSSFDWRKYMWQQVFTGGRGMTWIERAGAKPVALWPMDPDETTVIRRNGRRFYKFDGREYPAQDVIDITFMLKRNQVGAYSPIHKGRKAIALAIAMSDYAGELFAGGGVPPLALEGPLPEGPDGFKRAAADIQRSIENARAAGRAFFGMPPGHSLKPLGFEPQKGQMIEGRLFAIQEIARIWNLPPVFVGDLSHGTFANTEQQDLQLVKHNIGQRAKQFEDELNLKLFGQRRRSRKIKHNMDGLLRGDFKTRMDSLARGVQTALITPNEARALEERPPLEHGDKLYIQGATVPLGEQPTKESNAAAAAQNKEPANADE